MSGPRAAVDIGSNSVRLLVVDDAGVRLTRELAITRLAAGVDRTGHLDDDALARTVTELRHFHKVWSSYGVDASRVRIGATSAVRDARDRERFLTAVEDATGVRPEVLSGQQEAQLAFTGATGALELAPPVVVLDIGGGSTELIVGTAATSAAAPTVAASVSLQLGCVRLTERCFHHDPPSPAERRDARQVVDEQLQEADASLAAQGTAVTDAATLVAVAGTATTLAALDLGLDTYAEDQIHATVLRADAVEALTTSLLDATAAERAARGPVQPGREQVIHGGAVVLDAILRRYGFDEVVISEADSLDGLARPAAPDPPGR